MYAGLRMAVGAINSSLRGFWIGVMQPDQTPEQVGANLERSARAEQRAANAGAGIREKPTRKGRPAMTDTNSKQTNHTAAAEDDSKAPAIVMPEWFVPPIVLPAAFVTFIVALALYRLFVGVY
jgi:hypothetical protein